MMRLVSIAVLIFVVSLAWAQQSGQTGQAGQAGQAGQTEQSGQAGQAGQADQAGQAGQAGMQAGKSGAQAGQQALSDKEEKFLKELVRDNQQQMEIVNMAAQKSQDPQVKQLAERLKEDHGKASQELMRIGGDKIAMSTEEREKGKDKDKQATERFQKLSGKEFDKEFAQHIAKGHKKEISRFEKFREDAKNPELKAWIEKALPAMRQHLQSAQAITGEERGYTPTGTFETAPGATPSAQPGQPAQPGHSGQSGQSGQMGTGQPSQSGQSSPSTR